MSNKIRTYIFTGILAILPVVVTVYVMMMLFRLLDGIAGNFVGWLIGRRIPGLGVILSIIVIIATGMITTNFIGKRIVAYLTYVVKRIPIVGPVYVGVKQITDAISLQNRSSFKQVVIIEYPRKGLYTIALVTSENKAFSRKDETMYNLFIPTTPNPTSGFLIVAPESEMMTTNLSVEEGIKLIISGGLVEPSRMDDLLNTKS